MIRFGSSFNVRYQVVQSPVFGAGAFLKRALLRRCRSSLLSKDLIDTVDDTVGCLLIPILDLNIKLLLHLFRDDFSLVEMVDQNTLKLLRALSQLIELLFHRFKCFICRCQNCEWTLLFQSLRQLRLLNEIGEDGVIITGVENSQDIIA